MKKIKICPICGKEHTKRRSKCCCVEHSQELSRRNHFRKPVIEKVCPKCGTKHTKPGIYCSRHCANGREQTPEIRERKSQSIKRYLKSIGKQKTEHDVHCICVNCGREFVAHKRRKYCSKNCQHADMRPIALEGLKKATEVLKSHGNWGGYREGSGRSKSGYYKGIYCGSTYELAWMIYQLDNNRDFSRFEGMLEWNGVKYIPDFLQDGKIIEIKGYEKDESVARKTAVANHFGYEVIVLRKEDLRKEFEWVKTHYQYKTMNELYDDYKPKFVHVCDNCGKEFSREWDSDGPHHFCSRKCVGKFNGRH